MDKALHLRKAANGRTKIYKINPYRTCTVNGRYYLICNVDKYDSLCHFRIDRILDAKQLKSAAKFIPDFDTPVYLYCANGARAERAAKRLRRAGYKNIKSIGGVEGYRGELVRG